MYKPILRVGMLLLTTTLGATLRAEQPATSPFEQVKLGQTRDEVHAVMGLPSRTVGLYELWETPTTTKRVEYDDSGKVAGLWRFPDDKPLIAQTAQKPKKAAFEVVATGTLLNFTEERYNESYLTSDHMQSCVNRDYEIAITGKTLTLGQSTCNPNLNPALRVTIGAVVPLTRDKNGRWGILDTKGNPHWYVLFKEALTAAQPSPANLAPANTTLGQLEQANPNLVANTEAGKGSPAAAAALAYMGRELSAQEQAEQIQEGQASMCAVTTVPPGAEVDVYGNKAGVTPILFVLYKHGDAPRTITIKMKGYKTIEKNVAPDGKTIPIGLTLDKVLDVFYTAAHK